MRLLIDTNVAIDFLTKREPFNGAARKILSLCAKKRIDGFLSANSATTMFYILRKAAGKEGAENHLKTIFKYLDIADTAKGDIQKAIAANMPDFEDAVLAFGAKRIKADYVITRDLHDFKDSPVKAISPDDFLKQYAAE